MFAYTLHSISSLSSDGRYTSEVIYLIREKNLY